MDNDLFRVKPVERYEGARYFAAPLTEEDDSASRDEPARPLTVLVAFVLVLGLSVGLIGCYMRSEYTPDPPPPLPDADPPDPPDPPDCTDGLVRCADELTVETCDAGEWVEQDCDEQCFERMGPDAYSLGCSAEAEDPCQCQYDIVDGIMEECSPEDTYCVDDASLQTCEDGSPLIRGCDEVCHEEFGPDYWSNGCDASDAENPCQCVYDMIDGGDMWCEPGDLWCEGDDLASCDDDHGWTVTDCDELCAATYGPAAVSNGCDASDAENPCLCDEGASDSK